MPILKKILTLLFVIMFCSFVIGQGPVTMTIGSASGMVGDIVCVDIVVEGFDDAASLEWFNRWNSNVIRLDTVDYTTSALNEGGANLLGASNFNFLVGNDRYGKFTWFDNSATGVTLDDGDILYTLCFELIGEPCEFSEVTLTGGDNEFLFEVAITEDSTYTLPQDAVIINPGTISIESNGFVISESHCSSDDANPSGSITFAATGGNGPYSWEISGNGVSGMNNPGEELADCETATVDNLGPGTYTITFTDANGVIRNEVITIQENSAFPFIVSLTPTDPTCFDKNNGRVTVEAIIGGDAPYEYSWSTFQFVEEEIGDLFDGEYSLTVTDANGCTTSASTILSVDTLKVNVEIVSNPTCDGTNNGIVTLSATGGTPFPANRYEFEVSGINGTFFLGDSPIPVNPYTLTNYPAGCFEVEAVDDLNCVSDPVQFCLEQGTFGDLTLITDDVSCFGDCDGEVLISVTDNGNFSFQLRDADGNLVAGNNTNVAFDKDDLCPGEYTMTITNTADNCEIDTMFTIGEPPVLELMVIDSIGPGCGGGDGMISFEASGGTPTYTYSWNDGFDQSTRENMSGGPYSVTVTDENGCEQTIDFTFGPGGSIGLEAIVCQAVSCASANDGSICASVSVAGNYTFQWEASDGSSLGFGEQIDNVGGGIYYVTATDGECTALDTVIVAPGQNVTVEATLIPPTCPESTDGTLSVSLQDGVAPAMFEWTQPPSTSVLSNGQVLIGGVGFYNLNIVDANGCEADTLLEILPPSDSIVVDISNIIGVSCAGECNGMATLSATGGASGIGDYTYFINGIAFSAPGGVFNASVLCAGDNTIVATDGVCSTTEIMLEIEDAEAIAIDFDNSSITPPSCNGDSDGSITVVATGGNSSSYDYFWINEGISGATLTNLSAGDYDVEITDANGCTQVLTIALQTPDPLMVSIDPFTTIDLSCFSSSEGRIGLNTTGGNAGTITYTWSPNVSTTDFASNLGPGVYSVTATDSNGCTDETSYELTSSAPITFNVVTPEEPSCFGEQTCIEVENVGGGSGNNFTFTINNGPRLDIDTCFNVFAGPYLITVFDGAGCSVDTSIVIDQPNQLLVDAGPDLVVDLGESSDPVSVFIVSELSIDSISWFPFQDIECNTVDCQVVTFTPTSDNTYTVQVTDENGCTAQDEIFIQVDLARNIFIPNVFSPEGDNRNDFFQLGTGTGVEAINYLKIYDRWGSLMFQDESYMPNDMNHQGWDGTRNGQEVEPGVYVFFAEVLFTDGQRVLYKGDVTLIR